MPCAAGGDGHPVPVGIAQYGGNGFRASGKNNRIGPVRREPFIVRVLLKDLRRVGDLGGLQKTPQRSCEGRLDTESGGNVWR